MEKSDFIFFSLWKIFYISKSDEGGKTSFVYFHSLYVKETRNDFFQLELSRAEKKRFAEEERLSTSQHTELWNENHRDIIAWHRRERDLVPGGFPTAQFKTHLEEISLLISCHFTLFDDFQVFTLGVFWDILLKVGAKTHKT